MNIRLLVFILPFALLYCPLFSFAEEYTFQTERPFHGLVKREMAEKAALAASEQAAMQNAMQLLAQDNDFIFMSEGLPPSALPPIDGLAMKVFSTKVINNKIKGFLPDMRVSVEIALVPQENLHDAILKAFDSSESLEMFSLLLARKASLVTQYDVLYPSLLSIAPKENGSNPQAKELALIIDNLNALDELQKILPEYTGAWNDPEKAYGVLKENIQKSSGDPLLLISLAKATLQLDRTAEALDYAQAAIKLSPDIAVAHDTEGVILLRQSLPSLAVESFNKAIRISSGKPVYHIHRASAYLALHKNNEMCSDLYIACTAGECDGYEWAIKENYCEKKDSSGKGESL